jgi:hypothetical protein
MSIPERPAVPSGLAAAPSPDRLRVITAGRVGTIEARLRTTGFEIVAMAETEEDLIIAMSAGEPDAVVVEADLCESLEQVRDLAPNAVVIAVGDHTPTGALGRIQRGVSATVMAGLLRALAADGVGAAVVFGFLPALRRPAARVPHHVTGSLLRARAQLLHVIEMALPGQPGWAAVAGTVAVTVSTTVVLMSGHPRTDERPRRLHAARTEERALRAPLVAVAAATPTSAHRPSPTGRDAGTRHGRVPHTSAEPASHRRPSKHQSPRKRRAPTAREGSRPPGRERGLDHRPTSHADHGRPRRELRKSHSGRHRSPLGRTPSPHAEPAGHRRSTPPQHRTPKQGGRPPSVDT